MARFRRVTNIRSRRKITVLVLKYAVQHQKFLSAGVNMGRESTAGRVADDRCRPGNLIADPVEHPPIYPWQRRALPGQIGAMHSNPP